jgi:flavodoxin
MTDSRCLIVCQSVHHGNTARVAEAMASVLGAEVAAPAEVSPASVGERELVGFGSGVYYGRMHEAIFEWVGCLPDGAGQGRRAFVFSTSGLPFLARVWHQPLKKLLRRKGFEVVGGFSCGGYDTWGPLWFLGGLNRRHPDDRDMERARAFAERLLGNRR